MCHIIIDLSALATQAIRVAKNHPGQTVHPVSTVGPSVTFHQEMLVLNHLEDQRIDLTYRDDTEAKAMLEYLMQSFFRNIFPECTVAATGDVIELSSVTYTKRGSVLQQCLGDFIKDLAAMSPRPARWARKKIVKQMRNYIAALEAELADL